MNSTLGSVVPLAMFLFQQSLGLQLNTQQGTEWTAHEGEKKSMMAVKVIVPHYCSIGN